MLQQKRLPLLGLQLIDRMLDLSDLGCRRGRMLHRARLQLGLVSHDAVGASRSPAEQGSTFVDHDLVQPATESAGIPAIRQPAIRADERRVERVVRVIAIAHHPDRKTEVRVLIPPYQYRVGVNLAAQNRCNELGVCMLLHPE